MDELLRRPLDLGASEREVVQLTFRASLFANSGSQNPERKESSVSKPILR